MSAPQVFDKGTASSPKLVQAKGSPEPETTNEVEHTGQEHGFEWLELGRIAFVALGRVRRANASARSAWISRIFAAP